MILSNDIKLAVIILSNDIKQWCMGGARGVAVIVIESGLGYTNSNPERNCLHFRSR